jgi:pimeloyl-ACP methyl ester carboxylesterase
MGAVVALGLLQRFPGIQGAVLICPALYESREHALKNIESAPLLQRLTLRSTRLAHVVCETACVLRPVLRPLAPLIAPGLPAEVARAGLDHTWASYSRTLESIVFSGIAWPLLREVGSRVHLLAALDDRTVPFSLLQSLSGLVREFVPQAGDHEVLLMNPAPVAEVVLRATEHWGAGRSITKDPLT